MKLLYAAGSLQEAKILSDVLTRFGIQNIVKNIESQGLGGEIPLVANYPTLYVFEEDWEEATKIVRGKNKIGSVWTCQCGEVIEPQFSECWNCGKSRR